jgi:hypothetical protein
MSLMTGPAPAPPRSAETNDRPGPDRRPRACRTSRDPLQQEPLAVLALTTASLKLRPSPARDQELPHKTNPSTPVSTTAKTFALPGEHAVGEIVCEPTPSLRSEHLDEREPERPVGRGAPVRAEPAAPRVVAPALLLGPLPRLYAMHQLLACGESLLLRTTRSGAASLLPLRGAGAVRRAAQGLLAR